MNEQSQFTHIAPANKSRASVDVASLAGPLVGSVIGSNQTSAIGLYSKLVIITTHLAGATKQLGALDDCLHIIAPEVPHGMRK